MLIQLKDIVRTYKGKGFEVEALKKINFEIEQGEMVAIMGASGSGKSTLLNILGCIDHADQGSYFLDGKEISDYSDSEMAELRNKMFGFVLQDFALVERYSVAKNIMIPLYYSDVKKKEYEKKVDNILQMLDMQDKKKQKAMYLSGGQRQRVAIARALINDASILLCDEPTGALDRKTGQDIVNIFKTLNEAGKTVIIVTHDPDVAKQCERTIYISDGEIGKE